MNKRKTEHAAVSAERREYFRIDDAVRLSIRRVEPGEVDALIDRLEQGMAGSFTVMSSLSAISAQMAAGMRRIEHADPDVALYLKALDQKIEILGRAFLATESDLINAPARGVNLSAGGMSLAVREPFEPGDSLEIKMLLFPSFTGVLTYAEVIDCVPAEAEQVAAGYPFRVRVGFSRLREQDRDILIRHIIRRQSESLRGEREAAEAE